MNRKYYLWVPENTLSYAQCSLRGTAQSYANIPSEIAELPQHKSPQNEQVVTKLEIELDFVAKLVCLPLQSARSLIAFYGDKVHKVSFVANEERKTQVEELLPKSLSKLPIFGELGNEPLIERYFVLDSESFPHSLLRQMLAYLQMVVWEGTGMEYVFSEADHLGKYVARYHIEPHGDAFVGTKRRVRYLYTGFTSLRNIHITPSGQTRFVLHKRKGLTQVDTDLSTTLKQNASKILQENVSMKFKLLRQTTVTKSYRRRLVDLLSRDYRPVSPWELIEKPSFTIPRN